MAVIRPVSEAGFPRSHLKLKKVYNPVGPRRLSWNSHQRHRRRRSHWPGPVNLADGADSVAGWADDYRRDNREAGPWQYINAPLADSKIDMARECPNGDCVIRKTEMRWCNTSPGFLIPIGPAPHPYTRGSGQFFVAISNSVERNLFCFALCIHRRFATSYSALAGAQ